MTWLIGIGSSVAGAAVWAAAAFVSAWIRDRRGSLAGDWLQVTYAPNDLAMEQDPWSIEWIRLRHRRVASRGVAKAPRRWRERVPWNNAWIRVRQRHLTVSGAAWRVYPVFFDRLWLFSGRVDDPVVGGIYWAERGEGGHGGFQMHEITPSVYRGKFTETILEFRPNELVLRTVEQPMEWVRWGSHASARFQPFLEAAAKEREFDAGVPAWIRRRVLGEPSPISEGIADAAAVYDPRLRLEHEAQRRRKELERRAHADIDSVFPLPEDTIAGEPEAEKP